MLLLRMLCHAEDAEAEEPVPSKKQRSAKQKRAASASLPAKRGSRALASGHLSEGRNNGSLDEDYVPPGASRSACLAPFLHEKFTDESKFLSVSKICYTDCIQIACIFCAYQQWRKCYKHELMS